MCVVPIFRDEKGRDPHDLRRRLGSAAIWNTHSVWPVLVLLQREVRGAPFGRLLALPCGQWCGALLPDHSGKYTVSCRRYVLSAGGGAMFERHHIHAA